MRYTPLILACLVVAGRPAFADQASDALAASIASALATYMQSKTTGVPVAAAAPVAAPVIVAAPAPSLPASPYPLASLPSPAVSADGMQPVAMVGSPAWSFDFSKAPAVDPAMWTVYEQAQNNPGTEIAAYRAGNIVPVPGLGWQFWAHKGGDNNVVMTAAGSYGAALTHPWTGAYAFMALPYAQKLKMSVGCMVMSGLDVPKGAGLWSGFPWYLNAAGGWPPEIDGNEGGFSDTSQPMMNTTEHYTGGGSDGVGLRLGDLSSSVHQWTVCQDGAKITYLLDGMPYRQVAEPADWQAKSWTPVIDLTVGTGWPSGAPNANTPSDANLTATSFAYFSKVPTFQATGSDKITVSVASVNDAASHYPVVGLYLDGAMVGFQNMTTSPQILTFPATIGSGKKLTVKLLNPYFADDNGNFQWNTRQLILNSMAVNGKLVAGVTAGQHFGYSLPISETYAVP